MSRLGNGIPRKTLGLNKPERGNSQKHPSAKALCDENGEILTPSNIIKSEILAFNIGSNDNQNQINANNKNINSIIDKNKSEDNKDVTQKKIKNSFFIQINTCEHKKIDDKESFYIKVPPNNNNNCFFTSNNSNKDNKNNVLKNNKCNNNNFLGINKNLNLNSNPNQNNKALFYGFDSEQKKFDKEITNDMSEGKDYKVIENKFLNVLKKKK